MNDYTPSDAAKAYSKGLCTISHPNHRANCLYETSFDAGIAHERESRKPRTITTASEFEAAPDGTAGQSPKTRNIFVKCDGLWYLTGASEPRKSYEVPAFGPLTLLVPASESAPEPVRLTAAEAAGLRPGSWVRGESNDGSAVVGVIRQREVAVSFDGMIRWFDPAKFDRLYLLAEAPDPDAEKVAALVNYGLTETAARGHLAILREAGLRVDQ